MKYLLLAVLALPAAATTLNDWCTVVIRYPANDPHQITVTALPDSQCTPGVKSVLSEALKRLDQ